MKDKNIETYTSPIGMTQQFRFCGNPFRIDMYKGCDFGCKYCFANSSQAKGHNDGFAIAKIKSLESVFKKAFETDEESKDVTIELLRHRVPLHCGGMSDPFQKREFEYKLTYKLIELSNKYNYPICFSTKQCDLPDEYFKILNPEIHAFQVSIMGWDDEFIKKYETNTPTAKQRLDFVKKLRDKGFWCAIRIQPLVDLDQAKKLVYEAGRYPNYIIIEHLKIPNDNNDVKKLFLKDYNKSFYKSPMNMRNIEIQPDIKEKNINIIKEIANKNGVIIGVGDNDLHHLSQSRCCCGIDTINSNFDNYLKYNLTYFITGECENPNELWKPQCNCKQCFFSSAVKSEEDRFVDYKKITDKYINDHDWLVHKSDRAEILKKLFNVSTNRLF